MEDIGQAQGVFSEWGIFVYAICHSDVVPIITIYLYESSSFFLSTIQCFTCLESMFQTITTWESVSDMQCIIYINGTYVIRGGCILRTGCVSEWNAMFRSEDAPVPTMHLYELWSYWFPNSWLACLKRMLETITVWQSISDMKYNLLQWNTYA